MKMGGGIGGGGGERRGGIEGDDCIVLKMSSFDPFLMEINLKSKVIYQIKILALSFVVVTHLDCLRIVKSRAKHRPIKRLENIFHVVQSENI